MTYEDNTEETIEKDKANSESLFRDKYKPYSVLAFISTFVVLVLVLGILIVLMINN